MMLSNASHRTPKRITNPAMPTQSLILAPEHRHNIRSWSREEIPAAPQNGWERRWIFSAVQGTLQGAPASRDGPRLLARRFLRIWRDGLLAARCLARGSDFV